MEKKPEKEPMGPAAPSKPGDKPAAEEEGVPKPSRPPHWHEGDPEPEDEETAKHPAGEEKHLPPKDDVD